MAWTAPATFTTSEVVTAAKMNAQIRDNLLETAPGKATTAGGLFVATGANAIAQTAVPQYQTGDATYTGTGASDNVYLALSTAGWGAGTNVTITMTTSERVLVLLGGAVGGAAAGVFLSYEVSGATTTINPNDAWAAIGQGANDGLFRARYQSDLTAGVNNFRLYAKSTDISVTTLQRPFIMVFSL